MRPTAVSAPWGPNRPADSQCKSAPSAAAAASVTLCATGWQRTWPADAFSQTCPRARAEAKRLRSNTRDLWHPDPSARRLGVVCHVMGTCSLHAIYNCINVHYKLQQSSCAPADNRGVCMYVCIQLHRHIYIYICMYIFIYIYTHTYIHVYTYTHYTLYNIH